MLSVFFGAGRNYECCKQPGGGFPHTPLIFGGCGTWMWLWGWYGDPQITSLYKLSCLHFTESSTLLFDCHLIQVPTSKNFLEIGSTQKLPLPKKLTAFGNLEDVKPPCQLLGIPATLVFLPLQPSKHQLLQPGQHADPF